MTRSQIQAMNPVIDELRRRIISASSEATPDMLEEEDREFASLLAHNMTDLMSSMFKMLINLDLKFKSNHVTQCVDRQLEVINHAINRFPSQDIGVDACEKTETIAMLPEKDDDEYGKEAIVKILMSRDKMDEADAREMIKEFEGQLEEIKNGESSTPYYELEEMFQDEFGLKPDYLFCFLNV